MSDSLLDSILGASSPAEDARIAADPALRAERERWTRLLALERRAFDLPLDAKAGERVAARVVDRVRHEEDRVPTTARRGSSPFWARVLAASVAAHVVVLGVWSFLAHRREATAPVDAFEPVTTLARGPDDAPPAPAEEAAPLRAPTAYVPAPEDRLPVERLFPLEPRALPTVPVPSSTAYAAFPRGVGRAMWVRGSDPMKRLLEARVGAEGSLDVVHRGLDALAMLQRADGSFTAGPETSASEATGLVLLAFLGDGQSSRAGVHRETVAKGVASLRAGLRAAPEAPPGPYLLAALAEDYMLVNGGLTPAESRARSAEIASLAARAQRASLPADSSPWMLASSAVRRTGISNGLGDFGTGAVPIAATIDPRTAVWTGTAALRAGQPDAFRDWASRSSLVLRARIQPDGLAVGPADATPAQRVEETALILLALQVPYRTY